MAHLQPPIGESQPGFVLDLPLSPLSPAIPGGAFLAPALASSSNTALFRGGSTPYPLNFLLNPSHHSHEKCGPPPPLSIVSTLVNLRLLLIVAQFYFIFIFFFPPSFYLIHLGIFLINIFPSS